MKGMKRKLAGLMAVCMIFTSLVPAHAETISTDEIPVIESIEVVEEVEQVSTTEVGSSDEVREEAAVYGEATPSVAGAGKKVEYNGKKWMSYIPDKTSLAALSIPGTHDSGTYNIRFRDVQGISDEIKRLIIDNLPTVLKYGIAWLTDKVLKALSPILNIIVTEIQTESGKCQDLTIREQLNAGVRSLDLRFRYDDGNWGIYHGCNSDGDLESIFTTCVCYNEYNSPLTLRNCFRDIEEFLDANPTEMIYLNIQDEGGEYNEDIEKELLELERQYGICCNYANRENSGKVRAEFSENQFKGIDLQSEDATLGKFRGRAFDITDAVDRISSWDLTQEEAYQRAMYYFVFRNYLSNKKVMEIQTNVMVKMYKKNDPHNECSLPFEIDYWGDVPVGFRFIDFSSLIITPREQADYVNSKIAAEFEAADYSERNPFGFGIVTMDFQTLKLCYLIANANQMLKNGTPTFTFTGGSAPSKPVVPEDDLKVSVDFGLTDEEKRALLREFSSGNDNDDDNEPLFTGTWTNSVKGGSWSQDSNGIWHYTSTEKFRNTWGYIQNPYAKEGQNTADWFWFDKHGNMLTGWQYINGKWYYLNPNKDGTLGACLIGPAITPDGYEVDASGAWTGR